MLSFEQLRAVNGTRCNRWHTNGIDSWSPSDWAVAASGEMGEVCNAIKKLNRVRDDIGNKQEDPARLIDSQAKAVEVIAEEIADTIIYLDLLALRLGIDVETAIRAKFNKVSERYSFPERL